MAERRPRPRPSNDLPPKEEVIRFETGQSTVVLRQGRKTWWGYYGTDSAGNHYDVESYLEEDGQTKTKEETGRRRMRTGQAGAVSLQRAWLDGGGWDPEETIDTDMRTAEEKGLSVSEPTLTLGQVEAEQVRSHLERREASRGAQALLDARAAARGARAEPVGEGQAQRDLQLGVAADGDQPPADQGKGPEGQESDREREGEG